MPGSSQLFHTSFHELPSPGFKSDFNSDVLYSQLRYQVLFVQTVPHPNCTPFTRSSD